MKIVICDQDATMRRGTDYEVARLRAALPEAEVVTYVFRTQEELLDVLRDADGCITSFLPMNEAVFLACPRLKIISINASGLNAVDLDAARRYGVTVCALRNYCTDEVAEHTMALMLACVRKLKVHQYRIERDKVWAYKKAAPIRRLSGSTLAIFGFGRIGQAVARRAAAFGLNILAVDPYMPADVITRAGAQPADAAQAAASADLISNHMSVMSGDKPFFDDAFFASCARQPIFLNAARGASVDEAALLRALDAHLLSGAGLDVLTAEQPDLSGPLFGREDVVITPHAAFYSEQSIRALQDISCDNMIAWLSGRPEDIDYIVQ